MSRLLVQQNIQLVLSFLLIVVCRYVLHKVDWPLSIVVLDCSVCTFYEKFFDCPAVVKILGVANCHVEGCVALLVLHVDFDSPRL